MSQYNLVIYCTFCHIYFPAPNGWQILFRNLRRQNWKVYVELWVCPDYGSFLSSRSFAVVSVFCLWNARERMPGWLHHPRDRNALWLPKKALNCLQGVWECPSLFVFHVTHRLPSWLLIFPNSKCCAICLMCILVRIQHNSYELI